MVKQRAAAAAPPTLLPLHHSQPHSSGRRADGGATTALLSRRTPSHWTGLWREYPPILPLLGSGHRQGEIVRGFSSFIKPEDYSPLCSWWSCTTFPSHTAHICHSTRRRDRCRRGSEKESRRIRGQRGRPKGGVEDGRTVLCAQELPGLVSAGVLPDF